VGVPKGLGKVPGLEDKEEGIRSKYPDLAIKVGVSASLRPGVKDDPLFPESRSAGERFREVFIVE